MTAQDILKNLLPHLEAENQTFIEWELFWLDDKVDKGEFHEDAKRETQPLRLDLSEEELKHLAEFSLKQIKENLFSLALPRHGRQPTEILFSFSRKSILPQSVTPTRDGLSQNANLTLKDALQISSLVARFPQLSIDAEFGQTNQDEIIELTNAFKRRIFLGIISGRKPSAGWRLLDRWGLLEEFLPEVCAGRGLAQNRFHAFDIFEHLLRAGDGAFDWNESVRWAALLHDIGKVPTRVEATNGEASFHNHEMYSARMVVPIMKRLAVPLVVGQKVKFLVRNHMFHYTDEWSDKAVRRFVKKVPLEELQDLIQLRLADRKGSGKKTAFPKALQKLIEHIDFIIAQEKEFKIKDLAIDGHSLMEMGVPASREMGDILKYLHEEVKSGRATNEDAVLRQLVREKMGLG